MDRQQDIESHVMLHVSIREYENNYRVMLPCIITGVTGGSASWIITGAHQDSADPKQMITRDLVCLSEIPSNHSLA